MGPSSLRNQLDRDVYQVIKKLEEQNGTTFKSVTQIYDAIQKSNSHIRRQKRRPLEDSIDRALQRIKEERQDSEDSEAEIEEVIAKAEDERFLLNRQLTKHWHTDKKAPDVSKDEARTPKKRRIETDGEDGDGTTSALDTAAPATNALKANGTNKGDVAGEKSDKAAVLLKKTQKTPRFKVEHLTESQRLGGMEKIYNDLFSRLKLLLKSPNSWTGTGWRRVPGIVLSGPAGIGKKSLVRSLAAQLEVPLVSLAPCLKDPERMEKSVAEAMDEAIRLAPSIIFIEDLERCASKSGGSGNREHHDRVADLLKEHMRRMHQSLGIEAENYVLALATTSNVEEVVPDLLQCDFFEQTIQISVPNAEAREDIFRVLIDHTRKADDIDYAKLARLTHGFVGADIKIVVSLAQGNANLRRTSLLDTLQAQQTDVPMTDGESTETLGGLTDNDAVTFEDLTKAIEGFVPSLRKEGFTVIPNVSWDQVGAMAAVKQQLQTSIIGRIKNPELYLSWGLQLSAGVMLWGPPGCGKTLVAQAVANEARASFILINGPELLNKYVGESEKAVREVFQRARASTPCILFFDEMDSLVPNRDGASSAAGVRVVNALLTELDGVQDRTGIYVIGTTNRPDMIDAAMLRPGRLSVRIFVDLPTEDERVDILRAIFKSNHPRATDAELARLDAVARDVRCHDFSGADLSGLHAKAAEHALTLGLEMNKKSHEIEESDWEIALATTTRSVRSPEEYRAMNVHLDGR